MQTLTTAFEAHLASEVTTLATCWSIARTDGVLLRFTDHDRDLMVGGHVYKASSGISPSAVSSQLGLAVDNLELDGMLNAEGIAEADVLAGRYDRAAMRIFMVDYTDPDAGELLLKTGWIGEVRLRDGSFVAEIRSLSTLLQQTVGEVYTQTCRARLGDARCKVAMEAYTVHGTVTQVTNGYVFADTARGEARNHFTYGQVTFTTGENAGLSMEVRGFSEGQFTLFLPMPHAIAAGDHYTALAGCDKALNTCATRFANAVNFRGEPHVPGPDRIFETAATRTK